MSKNTEDTNPRLDAETRVVHNGRNPSLQGGMINAPVYHGSTVVYSTLADLDQSRFDHDQKDKVVYGRLGNQSTFAFENAVADLENGFGCISTSSGMSAVTTSILAFAGCGDHILMVDNVYGPTRAFCTEYLTRIGVEVTFYDPMLGSEIETLVKKNTTLIFMESPGSMTFEIQDVPSIVSVAKQHGITTALDNSWATPLFFKPLDLGVNVSVIAATKYIAGHSDAMIGLITTDEENFFTVKKCRDLLGQSLAPDDVYLGARGLRTLSVRVTQHQRNALILADWLNSHQEVVEVIHPALENCPGHAHWKRDFTGSTGLFAFILKPKPRAALACMLDNMRLFSMGYSWGGYESLIVPQEPLSSRTATTWKKEGQLIRVHVGLENIDDLITDIEAGLRRYAEFEA